MSLPFTATVVLVLGLNRLQLLRLVLFLVHYYLVWLVCNMEPLGFHVNIISSCVVWVSCVCPPPPPHDCSVQFAVTGLLLGNCTVLLHLLLLSKSGSRSASRVIVGESKRRTIIYVEVPKTHVGAANIHTTQTPTRTSSSPASQLDNMSATDDQRTPCDEAKVKTFM